MRREWGVAAHPEWLVFEAEGQLQIRPVQYRVARHLIDNLGSPEEAGAIVQLNMGEVSWLRLNRGRPAWSSSLHGGKR